MDNLNKNLGDTNKSKPTTTNGGGGGKKKIPLELTAYGTTPSGKPRLFVCQICTRAFARLEHLRRHERSHTKEKPFTCGVCQRKFSRRDLLLRHAQKLHAGCADAITRLRRKSVKKPTDNNEDNDPDNIDDSLPGHKSNNNDDDKDVNFNLNLFGSDSIHNQINQFQKLNPSSNNFHSRSSSFSTDSDGAIIKKSRKNSELSKSVLTRDRGASFSAQSGQNYAANIPEFNDMYTGTDNVEFSTPQLNATQNYDEHSWLNNLSTIPGMNEKEDKKFDLNYPYMMPTVTMKGDFPKHRSDSRHSPNNGHMHSNSHSQSLLHQVHNSNSNTPNDNMNNDNNEFYGYSFYDIPESMMGSGMPSHLKTHSLLTPIKQEFEDDHLMDSIDNGQMEGSNNHQSRSLGKTDSNMNMLDQFDLNFMNDIGDLTNEIDVNSRFMPNGYSFYGDNPSVSSSNIDSPGYNHTGNNNSPNPNNYLNQSQILNIENMNLNPNSNSKVANYSKTKLFTNNLRTLISKALSKYPINGISNPIIPPNDKLEKYLDKFVDKFLVHYPFIHPSKLNEYEIMLMTNNEDYSNESSRACLPLLVATVGALLCNNKNDSEHLYEASRRTIHIYLETRKSKSDPNKNNNPLWLIQSLTLSVIYGLFSDNENNVFIVIRQLNALNSLVKTSIKENSDEKFKIYFTMNPQEREKILREEDTTKPASLFNNNPLQKDDMDETKFSNNIHLQSQTRIIFVIYRVTNFLFVYYNIPLTLSINDLNNLELPNKADDLLWHCKNVNEFLEKKNAGNDIIPMIGDSDSVSKRFSDHNQLPVLFFKDVLLKISKNSNLVHFNQNNQLKLLEYLSSFGFLTIVHGIFEINQFNSNLNTINIINNLSVYLKKDDLDTQIIDFGVLSNFIKISSLINFKYLKQQSWLKNHNELIKNYELLMKSINLNEFSKVDKVLDYSLNMLKFLLAKTEKFDFPEQGDQENGGLVSDLNGHNADDIPLGLDSDLESEEASFNKVLNINFTNAVDTEDINIILVQSLFHVFTLTSILWLKYLKSPRSNYKKVLSKKFQKLLNFTHSIEEHYHLNSIYKSTNDLSFNDTLYFLNIGESILSKIYNERLNFAVFDKLSFNIYQIRKFLINNESKYS